MFNHLLQLLLYSLIRRFVYFDLVDFYNFYQFNSVLIDSCIKFVFQFQFQWFTFIFVLWTNGFCRPFQRKLYLVPQVTLSTPRLAAIFTQHHQEPTTIIQRLASSIDFYPHSRPGFNLLIIMMIMLAAPSLNENQSPIKTPT